MARTDKPVAALIRDLKQRGLLEDTLVVWGGEFGRTPFREGRTAGSDVLGRDHYPDAFSPFLAGGGVKGGLTYGATDELGFGVVENKVHVHDLQATILHLLGFDHTALTYRLPGPRLPPDGRSPATWCATTWPNSAIFRPSAMTQSLREGWQASVRGLWLEL
jgi:arylsulfatase A-like enzyme